MTTTLETLIVHEKNTDFTVIWLHGLGADGYDFLPITKTLNLNNMDRVKFIFPHAPERPVTLNNGYVMRSWYDLYSIENENQANVKDIHDSINAIHQLIETEIQAGTPAHRIILAGFSQGAVIALYAGINFHANVAGVIALSGYAPHANHFTSHIVQRPRVFLAHGKRDTVVPYLLATHTRNWLSENNIPFDWHDYAMAHEVSPEEMNDIQMWLTHIIHQENAHRSPST